MTDIIGRYIYRVWFNGILSRKYETDGWKFFPSYTVLRNRLDSNHLRVEEKIFPQFRLWLQIIKFFKRSLALSKSEPFFSTFYYPFYWLDSNIYFFSMGSKCRGKSHAIEDEFFLLNSKYFAYQAHFSIFYIVP